MSYPTNRPLPPVTDEEIGYEPKPDAAAREIPWIDPHQHTQTLTWQQQENVDIAGARAVVMIAASYFQAPYCPIPSDNWRLLWDEAIRMSNIVSRNQFYDVHLAVGLHMGTKIENSDELLDVLPAYCDLEETVAVGETGIDPVQRGGEAARWSLPEQRDVVRRQMEIANEYDLPVIIHTPANASGGEGGSVSSQMDAAMQYKFGRGIPYSEPLFDTSEAKRRAVEIDIELAHEAGLPEERVVLDHADESIVEYVMRNTDCYLSFSLSHGVVGPTDIAAAIDEYGAERLLVDSDLASSIYTDGDAFLIRRLILDLLRLGISPNDVRQVVYENPASVFDLACGVS